MAKDLTDALVALTERANTKPAAKPVARGAASRVVSAAPPPGAASGGGSGAVASPWIETSRSYWPTGWQTTDGLFSFPAVRRVSFLDDNGDTIHLDFTNPAA